MEACIEAAIFVGSFHGSGFSGIFNVGERKLARKVLPCASMEAFPPH